MHSFAEKKSVYTITSGETGYSAARPQVPTRKKVDLLVGQVTSSCGKYPFSALFAGQRVTVPCEVFFCFFCCELGERLKNKASMADSYLI